MVSVLASMTTAFFNAHLPELLPEKIGILALFDCRVWQAPTLAEAANTFLWREFDAAKNSLSMAARHYYPHEALHKKTSAEMQEMLWQKGVTLEQRGLARAIIAEHDSPAGRLPLSVREVKGLPFPETTHILNRQI